MAMRKASRWLMLIVAAVVIGLVVVITSVLMETGDEGTSPLEIYIGEQIRAAINDQLKPQLDFTKPDYQYPKTVIIENVRLTAPDPSRKGRATDIVRIRRATLELGEIPEIGQPLMIERVRLEKPEINLVAISAEDATLIGFSDLLKTTAGVKPPDASPSEKPSAKLTDVFRIRLIQLVGGVIKYDPRMPSGKAMELDGINTTLEIEPSTDGWYGLSTKISREPILSASIDGRFNINDALAKISAIQMKMELGETANKTLPPELQAFLADHQVSGTLSLTASGEVNFNDMTKMSLKVETDLRNGFATAGDYRVKIDKLLLNADMRDQAINLSHFEVRALNGYVFATGKLALSDAYPASVHIEAESLDLAQLDRVYVEAQPASTDSSAASTTVPAGSNGEANSKATTDDADVATAKPPSPLRGTVDTKMDLTAPLFMLTTNAGGQGFVSLKDGRLIRVPVLQQLEGTISGVTNLFTRGKPSDQLHVEFNMLGDKAQIQKIDLRTPSLAIRGKGDVYLDGRLDLSLNGGPMEKVQSALGPFGEFTSILTDKLARYRVTGTVSEPKIGLTVAPGLFDGLLKKND